MGHDSRRRGRLYVVLFAGGLVLACNDAHTPSDNPSSQVVTEGDNGRINWPEDRGGPLVSVDSSQLIRARDIEVTRQLVLGTGRLGPKDEFGSLGGIALDAKGAIYIYDPLAFHVRVFDSSGTFIRDIGRKGSGPGELASPHGAEFFSSQNTIAISKDTLFVLGRKLHAFDTAGTYLGTSRTEIPYHTASNIAASPEGLTLRIALSTDARIHQFHFVTIDFAGEEAVIDSFRVTQYFYDYGTSMFAPPLPQPLLQFYGAANGLTYFASPDSFNISVRNTDGTSARAIAGHARRVSIRPGDIEDLKESYIALFRELHSRVSEQEFEREWAKPMRQAFQGRSNASFRNAIGTIVVSQDGLILISRPDLSDRPYRWLDSNDVTVWAVLQDNGQVLGNLRLPNTYWPKVFTGCALFGFSMNKDGSPTVVEYRLIGLPCSS